MNVIEWLPETTWWIYFNFKLSQVKKTALN